MLRRQNLGTLLVLFAIAEFLAFWAVVDTIGFGAAVLLQVATTAFGLSRLRSLGAAALGRVREAATRGALGEDMIADGALNGLGALLLVVPSFLSDLAGLALLAPSVRAGLRRRLRGAPGPLPHRAGAPLSIDLEATDWSRLDRAR